MGALIRAHDWSRTPLGPVERWSTSLRTTVNILLSTRHPMFLWWGPQLIQFYNDGYRPSLGSDRHPSALGGKGRECWAEIWPIIGGEVESIMAGGDASWHEDHLVPITRGDRVEDVYWSYSYSPVADDDGSVGGVLVTVQETTQRVLAERRRQLLRVLAQRLATADSLEEVCAVSQAVLEDNPSDVPYALIYLRSPGEPGLRLCSATGTAPGGAPEVLTGPATHDWPDAEILTLGTPDAGIEGAFVAGTNPRIPLDEHYQSFFGEIAHTITMGLDRLRAREEERRAEQRVTDSQRLQSVGALAGGVAHEVNNQMTVVLGLGEFVLRGLGPNHPAAADMQAVLDAGARAARVSQQLLTFTRQQFTQPQVLDLAIVLRDLEPVLREVLGPEHALTVMVDPGTSLISVDPGQLDQVLVDLLTNARDALTANGHVTITVSDAELDADAHLDRGFSVVPGRYVQLAVTDNGQGMSQATLTRIFEPFYTTKPVGKGAGLGLSMVYGIIKRHDGYVWAESRPGQGTTMRLYLPAASAERGGRLPPPPTSGARDLPNRPRTVWVVEDEANVRNLLGRTLAEEGMRVVAAADGVEALELLHAETVAPSIVITDLIMPRANGRQVADAVAARYPDASVLFMSGYAAEDMARRGLLPANAAFLQKPFTPTQLVRALDAILGTAETVS